MSDETEETTVSAETENEEVNTEETGDAEKAPDKTEIDSDGGDDGGEPEVEEKDWRQEIAEAVGNGDKKTTEKELRRLQKIDNPAQIWQKYRELESKFSGSKRLVEKPGDDATDAEKAAWRKANDVPDEPSGYLENLELDNGAVLGEQDKPIAESFASALHEAGAPPESYKAALNWYFNEQQRVADEMDERDENHKVGARQELKEEYGGAFNRMMNNMPAVFALAPGGSDLENEQSVAARVLGGRTADGRIMGDDPDVIRWFVSLNQEINPVASVIDMSGSGKSIDDELKEIETYRRTNKREYFKDEKMQARERELIAARDKASARG